MKKVFEYLKEYRRESILGPLFKLLEATFELLVPLVVAKIIDVGIRNNDSGYIVKMCLIMVALGVIGLVCSISAQYFAAKAAVGCTTKLRRALFEKIQSLDYTTIDQLGTSTMVTRMTSDINQVQTGVNLTLRLLLRSPFVVFGAMIMAFTIDAKSALIFVVTIPVLAIVVFGIMLVCIPLYRKVQIRLDKVLKTTRENLTGVRVLRAFNKEQSEILEFEDNNKELNIMQKFVGRISSLMNPITYIIINVATILLIYIGAVRVNSGIIRTGQVIALYNYMSQILVELIKLASLIINVTKSVACAKRIENVMELPSEEDGFIKNLEKQNYAIEFKNVDLRYKNAGANSLSNISFDVKHGETVGIIGGTGSGKTSLINLIPAFYKATSGEVLVNGVNVNDIAKDILRKEISIVQQKALLFHGTIGENLLWGNPNADEEQIIKSLEIAQAMDIVKSKSAGLSEVIEQGGKNLSGGQKQRLTIARALLSNANILILDDSSSALDFATDASLRKSLIELTPRPTVLIVSQRTSSIMNSDKIIVLDDGICVGIGTHKELLKSSEVYREIHDSQFKKEDNI